MSFVKFSERFGVKAENNLHWGDLNNGLGNLLQGDEWDQLYADMGNPLVTDALDSQKVQKALAAILSDDDMSVASRWFTRSGFPSERRNPHARARMRRSEGDDKISWKEAQQILKRINHLGYNDIKEIGGVLGDPSDSSSLSLSDLLSAIRKATTEGDATDFEDELKKINAEKEYEITKYGELTPGRYESHARARTRGRRYEAYGRDTSGIGTWWDIRETLHRAYMTKALTGQIEQHLHIANIDSEVSAAEVIRAAKEIFGDNVAGKVKDALTQRGYSESHARTRGRSESGNRLYDLKDRAKKAVREAYKRFEEKDAVKWGDIEKRLKKIISDNELDDVREAVGYPAATKEVDTRDVYDVLDSLGRSSAAMLQIEALFDSMGLVYESKSKKFK